MISKLWGRVLVASGVAPRSRKIRSLLLFAMHVGGTASEGCGGRLQDGCLLFNYVLRRMDHAC